MSGAAADSERPGAGKATPELKPKPGPELNPGPPDLRLLLPAAGAWLGAWAGGGLGAGVALALAAVAAAATGTAVAVAWRRHWGGPGLRGRAAVVLAMVVCLCGGLAAAGARTAARSAGPLPQLAADRAVVTATVVLTGDPVSLRGLVVGARRMEGGLLVGARVEEVVRGGRRWRTRHPVTVLAMEEGWAGRLPGEQLELHGRLGPPRSGDPVTATLSADRPPVPLRPASAVGRAAGRLRQGLREAAAPLPPAERGLLPGLVIGDTSGLPLELREDFRRTGLTHLVAVSGTNVAIVLSVALVLVRRWGAGPRVSAVIAGLALAGFVVLARPSPSVLRAAFMGGCALFATVTGRTRQALSGLCGAVVVLTLFDPGLARSAGFALSVCATAGLLVLAPPWRRALARRWPPWLADLVAVPLAAQAACAPVVAAIAGQLSLVAVPANLVAMPAVGAATLGGVLAALVAPWCLPAGRLLARLAGLPTGWLVVVATRLSRLPAASIGWPTGLRGAASMLAVTVVVGWLLAGRHRRRWLAGGLAGLLLPALGVPALAPGWPVAGWALVACDVGQGDALVLRGGGATVVVDAGPDPAAVDACLSDLGVRRVTAVVLTHLHADHVEGLPGVLRGRSVGDIATGPLDEPADERRRVDRWAQQVGLRVRRLALGDRWQAGGIRYDVLGPAAAFRGTASDPNNSSLVLRVRIGRLRILLTGDIEQPAQLAALSAGSALRADVLKVPHHGSSRQVDDFLAATGARLAVISVGRTNPYGHPAPGTVRRVVEGGMRTFRTDRDGDIAVVERDGRLTATGRRGRGQPPRPRPLAWTLRPPAGGLWCPVRPTDPTVAEERVPAAAAVPGRVRSFSRGPP